MSKAYTIGGNACTINYHICAYTDPYNPLDLPLNIIRVRTSDGLAPRKVQNTTYEIATQVPGTTDVYDVYKSGTDFTSLLQDSNNVIEVLGANTKHITDMTQMFENCTSLSSIVLFDTTHVSSTRFMFASTNIKEVPLYNTSNVSRIDGMFWGCISLPTIPELDTSNAINMGGMLGRCASLTSVPLLNTSNVTSMAGMFNNSYSISSVPLFDTHNVVDMNSMFNMFGREQYYPALTAIPLFDTSNVTGMSLAFYGCSNVQTGAYDLYYQASTQANPPIDYTQAFHNCGDSDRIPSAWKD